MSVSVSTVASLSSLKPWEPSWLAVSSFHQRLVGLQEAEVVLGEHAVEVVDVAVLSDDVLEERLGLALHSLSRLRRPLIGVTAHANSPFDRRADVDGVP